MEGNLAGSSEGCSSTKELGSKQAMEERENSNLPFCSWTSPGNRGCAPRECTLKLPTRLEIAVSTDSVYFGDMNSRSSRKISFSNFLRTLSSPHQDVEAILCRTSYSARGIAHWSFFGEVCEIVKSMPSVKEFILDYGNVRKVVDGKWAEAISQLVVGNSTLIKLDLRITDSGLNATGMKLLVDALLQNQALQECEVAIGMSAFTSDDMGPILENLCRYVKVPNNVLTRLDIDVNLKSKGDMDSLAALICNNTRLKYLEIQSSATKCEGFNIFWDNLGSNTVLETLVFINDSINDSISKYDIEAGTTDLKELVKMLTPNLTSKVQPNSSLHCLGFQWMSIEIEGLATLIQSNTSLLNLTLNGVRELMIEYCECAHDIVEKILISLQFNVSLEILDLSYCSVIGGKKVLGMIMDMLLHNRTIKKIDLSGTPLQTNGDDVIVKAELSKREEDNLWRVVQDMDTTNPDSARIFLCGMGEAGKTTLSSTWRSSPSTFTSVQRHGTCFDWRQILRRLFACTAWKLSKPKNLIELKNERTRGIEVHNMNIQGVNISIWDMAGQEEYHTFHDWMIPNRSASGNCCMYVILCDPTCKDDRNRTQGISEIKQELLYWLQFVASNTRRSYAYRPHVTIVLTHFDLWGNNEYVRDVLTKAIDEFRDQFQDLLEVDTHVNSFFIDARSQNHASMVLSSIHSASRLLLETLPKEIKACKVLLSIIQEKNKRGVDIPFLKWSEFSLMCEEVDGLKSSNHTDETILTKKREFVATSLHDGGFIIYFKGIDIVILNPQWFCHDIMGEMISICARLDPNLEMIKDGVISRNHLQIVFTKSFAWPTPDQHFDAFLNMMMKLQVCYEQDNEYIMIPSTLQDTEELNWQHVFDDENKTYNYIGTRLTSKDETLTILTSGFFPRLQVFLQTKFSERNLYKSYKNIISYIDYGNEIIIACDDGAINIMSRSSGPTDHIVHKKAINAINELRSISTLGCPGVIFEEYVLRPQCVKLWFRGMDVRMQVVSKKELRRNVLLCPDLNYPHYWPLDDRFGIEWDWVKALLGDEEWQEALQMKDKISKDMNNHVQRIIGVAVDDVECDPCHKSTVSDQEYVAQSTSMTNDFQLMWNKIEENHRETQQTLKGMDAKMDRYHKEIKEILETMEKKIIASQQKLASKICSNINELMRFSIHLQQSKVPKLAYFCKSQDGGLKNLLTQVVPGLISVHLHLMCEHKSAIHIVDAQLGYEVRFSTDQTKTFGTIMYWGLTLVTMLLKVGAHVIAGAGGMVPDLTKDIMLILDAPGVLDLAQPRGPMLECLPPEMRCNSTINTTHKKMAEDWLIQILKPMCDSNEIHKKFKLNKVMYTKKSGKHEGVIAWVCDRHKAIGENDGTMERI